MTATVPKKIGVYQVRGEVGGNGRTRVYRAYDSLTGEVAIKLLPSDFFHDAAFHARFDREVKTLTLLEDPAIVPIIDIDSLDGQPYLVMRYIGGGTLADRLTQGALPLEDAYRILYDLASALDAAAARGIYHGNIKPSNILLDEAGEVYLSDFSMATPPERRPASLLNVLPNTAAYMSPEQVLRGSFDRSSDIYALGAVLYHMITGQPPVSGATPVQQAVEQVSVPPPDALVVNPKLPPACQAVIEGAMSKEPTQRYSTASEMVNALAEVIEVVAEPVTKPIKGPASRRVWAWALAGITLLVLIALGVSLIFIGKDRIVAMMNTPSTTPTRTHLPPTQTPTEIPTITPFPTATSTPKPTLTSSPVIPTATETHTPTSQPTIAPTLVIIGGAYQIAFFNENDIWIVNLDGSGLERLTQDKIPKLDLRWTPDGSALTYIINNCIQMLDMKTRNVSGLGCYPEFEISPDTKQIVIGDTVTLPNKNKQWMNFIMPYNLDALRSLGGLPQIERNGGCPFIGGKHTRFSSDGKTMAAVFNSPGATGRLEDLIVVFQLGKCGQEFDRIDMFPGTRFSMKGYNGPNDSPTITDFGWDSELLFALHGDILNGYGDMLIYNMGTGNSQIVNPVDGQCCYKDMQWSPDGLYFVFAFQDNRLGKNTRLYYGRYGDIGTGMVLTPLELPFYFFGDSKAVISPALRPYVP